MPPFCLIRKIRNLFRENQDLRRIFLIFFILLSKSSRSKNDTLPSGHNNYDPKFNH